MAMVKIPLDTAVAHIAKGVELELEKRIRDALMAHAEKVVCDVARSMAETLRGSLKQYEDVGTGDVFVTLQIDGVKETVGRTR